MDKIKSQKITVAFLATAYILGPNNVDAQTKSPDPTEIAELATDLFALTNNNLQPKIDHESIKRCIDDAFKVKRKAERALHLKHSGAALN